MTHLAITLIHNKSNAQNQAQITALKSLLTTVTDGPFTDSETGATWTTTHHEITGLAIPHTVKVYQIIPFGVTPPPNRYEVNSGGIVYYGKGDEDKTGEHPRFFNWGLKRGTDNGADVSVYLTDPANLTATKARNALNKLVNDTEFVEETWGKIGTLKLLKQIGQLKEDRTFTQAVSDFKTRVVQGGLKNG